MLAWSSCTTFVLHTNIQYNTNKNPARSRLQSRYSKGCICKMCMGTRWGREAMKMCMGREVDNRPCVALWLWIVTFTTTLGQTTAAGGALATLPQLYLGIRKASRAVTTSGCPDTLQQPSAFYVGQHSVGRRMLRQGHQGTCMP